MKLAWTAAALLALAACSQPATETPAEPADPVAISAPSGAYTLDGNHTSVTVRALHFGLSHYTLRLNDVSGQLEFNAEEPAQSSVTVTVGTNSVDTDYDGNRDFNAELQNSDWLNAAEFPQATFQSTSIELTGANTGRMSGDLTIAGVTHPATFDVTFNHGFERHPMGAPHSLLGFSARGVIQRSQYGMTYLMASPGGFDGVSDEVELLIEAEFIRPIAEPAEAPAPDAAD